MLGPLSRYLYRSSAPPTLSCRASRLPSLDTFVATTTMPTVGWLLAVAGTTQGTQLKFTCSKPTGK